MELKRVLEILKEEGVFLSNTLKEKLESEAENCYLQELADADYCDFLDSENKE